MSVYVSVRDCFPFLFGTIKTGLDAMGINAVELEYFHDRTVFPLDEPHTERKSLADDSAIDVYASKCAELNVRVSALLLHNNFAAEDLEGELDWVISAVRAAHRLGARAMRIDSYMTTESDWPQEKRIERFAECMKRVLDATADLPVEMGIENHGLQGNEQGFIDTILNRVNSPRLGLTIDTANLYWYGYPLSRVHELIEYFAPRVKHTHVKSIKYPADQREIQREIGWAYDEYASPLREGDIDIKRLIDVLHRAGYEGDLCIENEALSHFDLDGQREALIDDAGYLGELLQRL
jgi:sugar phosphate isomerase/epimerase